MPFSFYPLFPMPYFEIILVALALSMDAFAVAIATGVRLCQINRRQFFRLCFHFGLFQCLMPIIGWALGLTVRHYIEAWDHWVAFALLTLVAINMIRESLSHEDDEKESCLDPTKGWSLVLLSVATSIDALAVGLSIAALGYSIWLPAAVIGVVCAGLTFVGLHIGRITAGATVLGSRAALLGGLTLLGIGLNILREHGALPF